MSEGGIVSGPASGFPAVLHGTEAVVPLSGGPINNIAFSHASCNYKASRGRVGKPCPSVTAYRNGCRCEGCLEAKREYRKNKRKFSGSRNPHHRDP